MRSRSLQLISAVAQNIALRSLKTFDERRNGGGPTANNVKPEMIEIKTLRVYSMELLKNFYQIHAFAYTFS